MTCDYVQHSWLKQTYLKEICEKQFSLDCQSSGTLCSITGCLLPNISRLGGSPI
jgi:hypothetical protein